MTLYDELFQIHESLAGNGVRCTLEAYCEQSVFPYSLVVNELERLCEEGEFFFENGEYKVFVEEPILPSYERTIEILRDVFLIDNSRT